MEQWNGTHFNHKKKLSALFDLDEPASEALARLSCCPFTTEEYLNLKPTESSWSCKQDSHESIMK